MSKTEALCKTIASVAVCVTGVALAQIGGMNWGCLSMPLVILGIAIVWNYPLASIK